MNGRNDSLVPLTRSSIIDLDNCISDDEWRLKYIDWDNKDNFARFNQYHLRCGDDKIQNRVVVRQLQIRGHIIVFTSRPESFRGITMWWLVQHGIIPSAMYMRPDIDHRPSVEVKRAMFVAAAQNFFIDFAIDDRDDVLQMYVEEGLKSVRKVIINDRVLREP